MIKAIVFDCFGVLTTDTWNAFLGSLPEGTDLQAAREVHRAYDAGLIDKQTSMQQIKEITGEAFVELDDMSGSIVKNTQLLDYIGELKKTYKIGLLSNVGSNWIREKFLSTSEQALFDAMVFSYEIKANKPDQRMYQAVVDRLGVEPEEALMVDDKVVYCDAARVYGMKAVVYDGDFLKFKRDIDQILNHT